MFSCSACSAQKTSSDRSEATRSSISTGATREAETQVEMTDTPLLQGQSQHSASIRFAFRGTWRIGPDHGKGSVERLLAVRRDVIGEQPPHAFKGLRERRRPLLDPESRSPLSVTGDLGQGAME
jgi:hypothetical protein